MSPFIKHLGTYANYHRDPRNIATHFFGVPTILFAIVALLSRPAFDVGGLALSPAWFIGAAVVVWYFRLGDVRFALAMTGVLAACIVGGAYVAAQTTTVWLAASIGLFVGGWIVQFIGHSYEGKKPAFMDDLRGLLVGPLFIVAEAAFALGLRHDVKAAVEKIAGPVRVRTGPAAV